MPGIHFDFTAPVLAVLFLLLAGGIAAFWYYRFTIPALSGRARVLLSCLRGSVLALLLLLPTQPLLRLLFTSTHRPTLAILVDNSASMRIVDHGTSRSQVLRSTLHSPALVAASAGADCRYYTFGTSLRALGDPDADTLGLNEKATNLAAALQALRTQKEEHQILAALLITDGAFTLGRNPLYDADDLGIPLFSVGIGDTAEPRDLAITRVDANRIVYSGIPTPVDVIVKSSGFGGQHVEVRLLRGKEELARSSLALESGTRERQVTLSYTPRGAGIVHYTVEVDTLPGEISVSNNRTLFSARTLKSKRHLVLLAGAPSPDVAVLGQTLREEKDITLQSFTERRTGGYYEGMPGKLLLDSADCLVLLDYPSRATPLEQLRRLRATIDARSTPLLFLDGRQLDYARLGLLGAVVPFTAHVYAPSEQYVNPQVVETERLNPLVGLEVPGGAEVWGRLPPLFRTMTTYQAHPEAHTLIEGRTAASPAADPLVLVRSVGRQKSLAVTAYGLWRWRLLVQDDPQAPSFLSAFLSAAVQWLTSPEETRPVRVMPTKEIFVQGEPVEFTGEVYNSLLTPVENARVTISVRTPEGTIPGELRPMGNGRYEGSFEGLPEGEHHFTAEAKHEGSVLGKDSGVVQVGGISLELQDTRSNFALLRLIASRTGGHFFLPSQLTTFDSLLAAQPGFLPRQVHSEEEIELWNWRGTLALLILLLATEWIIRRRKGML
jgi:hypothetical protein